ncbi:MAG: YCF48-related protein [Gammaproteobacteria bacterium]|nr:YCF48-related protein [Gammaproteobacteria bacterium]MCY4338885.1 YCF48-related protein [Gammaproteobacteria bacterium]
MTGNTGIAETNGLGRYCLLAVTALLLAACESPLVLDEVEQSLQSPIRRTDNFQALSVHESVVVAVGGGGVILVSADGGGGWQRRELPSWPSFIDVTHCDDGLFAALAFEGEVWLAEDQGASWHRSELATEEAPQAIQCDPGGMLWVVGSFSTISTSRDRGASWETSSLDEDVIFTDIQFFDERHAYIAGEFGSLLKTTDAGVNWEYLAPMPDEFYPQSMYFADPDHGWVAGLGGVALATEDGGRTWQTQSTGSLVTLYTLVKVGAQLFVTGGEGAIFRYGDGAWSPVDHGQPFRLYLRGIASLPDNRLIVGGPGGVLQILSVTELVGGSL